MIPNAPGWGVRGVRQSSRFPRFPRFPRLVEEGVGHMIPNAPGWGVRGDSSVIPVPVSPVSPACGRTGGPYDTKCSGEGGQRGVRPSSRYQMLRGGGSGGVRQSSRFPRFPRFPRLVEERVGHMIPNAPGRGVSGGFVRHPGTKGLWTNGWAI